MLITRVHPAVVLQNNTNVHVTGHTNGGTGDSIIVLWTIDEIEVDTLASGLGSDLPFDLLLNLSGVATGVGFFWTVRDTPPAQEEVSAAFDIVMRPTVSTNATVLAPEDSINVTVSTNGVNEDSVIQLCEDDGTVVATLGAAVPTNTNEVLIRTIPVDTPDGEYMIRLYVPGALDGPYTVTFDVAAPVVDGLAGGATRNLYPCRARVLY